MNEALKKRGYHCNLSVKINGEDLFLHNYFKDVPKGRYIDIGAFHPFRSSNTFKLYKKGWSGFNIDLSKSSIDLFKLARPNDINLNLVISDKKEETIVYQNKDLSKLFETSPSGKLAQTWGNSMLDMG